MPQANVMMNVRRVNPTTSIIDIHGDVSAFAENVLMEAYAEANTPTTRTIILNFAGLEYMNSSGIGCWLRC
ncbi:MAG: STAS domain-containing protein [Chloroflexi bacterium]|nr:MAG: STAS domain-containing protein [Chloroflexota bacterium]